MTSPLSRPESLLPLTPHYCGATGGTLRDLSHAGSLAEDRRVSEWPVPCGDITYAPVVCPRRVRGQRGAAASRGPSSFGHAVQTRACGIGDDICRWMGFMEAS